MMNRSGSVATALTALTLGGILASQARAVPYRLAPLRLHPGT
jgi:hypothetical protein